MRAERRGLPAILPVALACGALYAVAALRHPAFLRPAVFLNLFADNATLGIVAIGMTFVIAGGGIDLSVGAVMAFSNILAATLITEHQMEPVLAVVAVLGIGAAAGAVMGALIHGYGLPAFLVTLGGMFVARGAALALHPRPVDIVHPTWTAISAASVPLGGAARLPLTGVIFIAVACVAAWIGRWTRAGRNLYAVGGHEEAALHLGVPIGRTRVLMYAASGGCAALSGVVGALYRTSGDPTVGVGLELEAIAAVVVGGAALTGGSGTALGTVLGVVAFGMIQTVLAFEGTFGAGWTRVVSGALLLAFVVARTIAARGSRE